MVELNPKHGYGGWPSCVRLANREVEVVATTDVGPRVLRYGPIGQENLLHEFAEDLGHRGGAQFRPYGGHRLWHAPEDPVRTYAPDNEAVEVAWNEPWLVLTAAVEARTGIEKRVELCLADEGPELTLRHRLTNRGPWPVPLAPWALTVMPPGGVAVVPAEPFVPFPDALTPSRTLVLWPYTKMNDPRFTWGARYTFIRQDASATAPVKLGAAVTEAWSAYLRAGSLFVKRASFWEVDRPRYPDFGVNVEVFTNADFLELESLGPTTILEPGGAVEHEERWTAFFGVTDELATDDDADRVLGPRLTKTP
jgi:hypothetical protein